MTQNEIRRLLGGYAINALTEGERTALFEAALEDQDLFDALQNDDALRELLADPVAREQIRQALQPAAAGRRRSFWTLHPWLFGGLIGAASVTVALVIAIGTVTWHRETARLATMAAPQPAPAIPAPARNLAAREQTRPVQLTPGAAASAPLAANVPLYAGPLVRYSVLRSGPSGAAVRIEVVSQVAGSLTLYRADAAGQWQRVFPVDGPGFSIAANASYQIPGDPIAIRGNQKKLRLVIEPAARPAIAAQLAAGALNEPRAQAAPRAAAAPRPTGPLVIEIPIGPN